MNTHDNHCVVAATTSTEGAIEREESQPILAVGQWYWVKGRSHDDDSAKEWFGCVMSIGSNYAELRTPAGGWARIHFDKAFKVLRYEPDPESVIQAKIAQWSGESRRLLEDVKEVSARLGLKGVGALPAANASGSGSDLVVLSGQADVAAYKTALIDAQDKTLPALFDGIKRANMKLTEWMTASTLPLKASVDSMKGAVDDIKDRIFNISLYAGLVEDAVCCSDGAPAPMDAKLHVMQRRLYMDEECLLSYTAGGMEFRNIREFDAWLAKPENRDRLLPFPRTLVAMRVRRKEKDREWDGSILSVYINIRAAERDNFTFLYVRNGEQLWRIGCEMEFGEMIFPDKAIYDPSEPMMVKMLGSRVESIITRREYDDRCTEWEKVPQEDRWKCSFAPDRWDPFDQTNVYFDECMASIADRIKEYNRIAVIIQGLFDRSQVLHPHPAVQAWTPEGFNRAIQLVYDAQMVLDNGAPPDFEAYRARCNASLDVGSVTAGQDMCWERTMAEKEMQRRRNDHRLSDGERWRTITRWKPSGNPGPGMLAVIQEWKPRSRVAEFRWTRERWSRGSGYGDAPVSFRAPASELFNVSAYTPGDYVQFFRDHRTREQYLKWAPLLLAAEDYHAGKASAING